MGFPHILQDQHTIFFHIHTYALISKSVPNSELHQAPHRFITFPGYNFYGVQVLQKIRAAYLNQLFKIKPAKFSLMFFTLD